MVIWGFFHDNGIDDDSFHCYWYDIGITGIPYFFDDNGIDNGIDDDDSRWSTGDENDPLVNIQKAIENDHR